MNTHRMCALAILTIFAVFLLCGCRGGIRDSLDETTTITRVMDFSAMVPALTFFCVIGIAASIAALIWIPIQKWIPLATLTFFAACIVVAWTVQWLTAWMPWIIGGGMCIGLLWLVPYLRRLLIEIRAHWNDAPETPNPTLIGKVLK